MATRVAAQMLDGLDTLRVEPTDKRVRAEIDGTPAVDSRHAVLVWEPRRVVPQYAVPAGDVLADLAPAEPGTGPCDGPGEVPLGPDGRRVLTPETGFGVHSTDGEVFTLRLLHHELTGAAFRPSDPDLDGLVVLDFAAFDRWLEEDEEIVGHPRDPFHRIDVRRSSRHVRVELDGHVLAESTQPTLLFETNLPLRYYLPASDVRFDLLRPSETVTTCAYKGAAGYWSAALPGRTVPDVAWAYPHPLPDSTQLSGLVSFFTERVDLVLDGVPVDRPVSPWS